MLTTSMRRRRVAAVPTLLLACGALGGCDIPTELPRWDTRWVIPAERTSFSVTELLPGGLLPDAAGESFDLALPGISVSRSLREMCVACLPLDGLTVPKPAFTVSFSGESDLPQALVSARLVGGSVEVRLQHDFSFDPLRPSATARGYLILAVRSGSDLLARDSIAGEQVAFPPGIVLSRSLALQPGDVADALEVEITLFSPEGDPVTFDVDDRLQLIVPGSTVRVSDLVVRLDGDDISTPPVQLELGDIDDAASRRIRSAAVHLEIDNPFDIAGDLELDISTAETHIARPIAIAPGLSNVSVELTGDEIGSLLGRDDVTVVLFGPVTSPPEGTPVSPDDEIEIGMRLELVVGSAEE